MMGFKLHPITIARGVHEHLRRRLFPGGLVLMYHRIANEDLDPWGLCVSPRHFEQHLDLLRARDYQLTSMQDLVRASENRCVQSRSVAITFDDGYVDNLLNAHTVLQRYEAPATIFVTAGQVGSDEEFWWDSLSRIFLTPGLLPDVLEITVKGEKHQWMLGPEAHYSSADAERWRSWRAGQSIPTLRHQIHNEVWKHLFDAGSEECELLIRYLLHWAGLSGRVRSTHRAMNEEELRLVASDGLVEIGAHTWTHASLPALQVADQLDELQRSKMKLDNLMGVPVVGCSYPHGQHSAATSELARQSGYVYACGSRQDVLRNGEDPFYLPRVVVNDWPLPIFEKFLLSYIPS